MALRSRRSGGGFKPPHAALAEDRRGERCGKGAREVSGGDQENGNPEPLLTCRQARVASKPWPLAGLWEQGLAGNPVSGQVVSGMEAA